MLPELECCAMRLKSLINSRNSLDLPGIEGEELEKAYEEFDKAFQGVLNAEAKFFNKLALLPHEH